MIRKKCNNRAGVEMVEIIIAIMVLGAVLVTGFKGVDSVIRSNIGTDTTTEGTLLHELNGNIEWTDGGG